MWLIEESIECYLRQDYDDKELIVLNDDTYTLEVDGWLQDAGVRVVNAPTRYSTLGAKYNAAIELSTGGLLCPWEDDDIMLPWRLSLSASTIGQCDYWNPHRYWFRDRDVLHHDASHGVAHAMSIFTRTAWAAVGGYPETTGDQDGVMDGLLVHHGNNADPPPIPPDQWFYLYRWRISPNHLSSRLPHQDYYDDMGSGPRCDGTYRLQPHWREDYETLCQHAIVDRGLLPAGDQ
jgi:glycosyltransferase involved in cell wall biosynthesis